MQQHTDKVFDRDLQKLKEHILKMGSLVEEMIARSVLALERHDSHLARDIISEDKEVDNLEMEIDDLCLRILALYQPAAVDLRFVAVGMKISTDLERMGDLAVNISRQVLDLNQTPPFINHIELTKLARKSQNMVKGALDAFVARDVAKAKSVCEADDEVDALDHENFDELVKIMQNDPNTVPRSVRLLLISRQLERIADHATNVAEEVTFFVKGLDMRHRHDE